MLVAVQAGELSPSGKEFTHDEKSSSKLYAKPLPAFQYCGFKDDLQIEFLQEDKPPLDKVHRSSSQRYSQEHLQTVRSR